MFAGEVHETAVQEHGAEDRCYRRYQVKLRRQAGIAEQGRGDHAKRQHRRLEAFFAQ